MSMLRIVLLFLIASAVSSSEVDFKFSEEELWRYFGVSSHDQAPEYEIVYPEVVTPGPKRSVDRNAIAASYLEVQVDAFDQTLHMALDHDDSNFRPGLEAEYVTDKETITVPIRTDCLYTGKVVGERDSLVSVSTCAGLIAVMYHANGPTYIEPLDDKHALKREIGRGLPHVAYKNMPDTGRHCGVEHHLESTVSLYEEDKEEEPDDLTPQRMKYLELGMVADSVLYDLRGSSLDTCIPALFNAGTRFYGVSAASIMNMKYVFEDSNNKLQPISIQVKNVLQLDSLDGKNLVPKLVRVKIFMSDEAGLKTCPDSMQSLTKAGEWQLEDNCPFNNPCSWDNVAVLTGWDLEGNTFGRAYTEGCGREIQATSLSMYRGLEATDTVSHEIGHNLGMLHDAKENDCSKSGYIMARKLADYRSEHSWSSCSRDYYNKFVSKETCYNEDG